VKNCNRGGIYKLPVLSIPPFHWSIDVQIEVPDLQSKIQRRDSAIWNLTDVRSTLESRMVRLREERDRYADQNSELLAVN
jgi:hypothetical protein